MIDFLLNRSSDLATWGWSHVWLSVVPVVLGFLIALPLGWLADRHRWTYPPLTNLAGLLYTVPSLSLFVLMPAVLGTRILSPVNVVVALTVYTVALLVRVIADGLGSVPADVRAATTAMGFTRAAAFARVDLPIAAPVITAGLRVAAVSNVSLVSVAALIGIPQLGSLFTEGFSRGVMGVVLLGVLACVAVALLLDLAILTISRWLTPWRRAVAAR